MKTRTLLATPLLFTSLTAPAVMAEDAADQTSNWNGSVELGVSIVTGNTDSSNLNGKLRIGHVRGSWKNRFRLEAMRASEDGDKTADRVLGEFESNYALTEHDYLFGALRASRDKFSGYDYQTSAALGYGRKLWVSDQGYWDAEIGPGIRVSKTDDGQRETNLIARLASGFEYQISDFAKLSQDLTVLAGSDNTEIESVTGLISPLTDTLALKLSYTVEHNTRVPADTKKTDTYTSISVVYKFD